MCRLNLDLNLWHNAWIDFVSVLLIIIFFENFHFHLYRILKRDAVKHTKSGKEETFLGRRMSEAQGS